jgi:peptidyl-prolyl cis-trans isomerase D
MLEAIRNRAQGILAWVIIGLITIPFALWGINNYFRDGGEALAATVNGEEITTREFRTAFQNYTQQMRMLMGASFSEEVLDDPALKRRVLDNLIEQRLMLEAVSNLRLDISDVELARVIRENEAFHNAAGQFNPQQYERVLQSQGLTPSAYEGRLRMALLSEQLASTLRLSALVTQQELEKVVRLQHQKREIGYGIVPLSKFQEGIQINVEELRRYYDEHPEEFRTPEQVVVDYLHLSTEALAENIPVDEPTLQSFYEESKDQYGVPEQRRASHILIVIPPEEAGGPEAAREKAEAVRKRLQEGEPFEEVAKEVSEDPGSAQQGGDLGSFGRGVMDPAFEEAVFSLEEVGEISEPVLSKFGYHVIQLTGIQPAEVKPFEEVRDELKEKYRQQLAEEQFYEQAETLENLTYESPFTLEVAAEALDLPIKTSEPFSAEGGSGIAANPKVVSAAFIEEVLQERMNSQAIELRPNELVVLRVKQHLPEDVQPFAEVQEQIEKKLSAEQARAKAKKLGEGLIERLQKGKAPEKVFPAAGLTWNEKQVTTRTGSEIQPEILNLAYQLSHPQPDTPIFSGQPLAEGDYAVVGLYGVQDGELSEQDEEARQSLLQELERIHGDLAYQGFIGEMKASAKVKVYTENL